MIKVAARKGALINVNANVNTKASLVAVDEDVASGGVGSTDAQTVPSSPGQINASNNGADEVMDNDETESEKDDEDQ